MAAAPRFYVLTRPHIAFCVYNSPFLVGFDVLLPTSFALPLGFCLAGSDEGPMTFLCFGVRQTWYSAAAESVDQGFNGDWRPFCIFNSRPFASMGVRRDDHEGTCPCTVDLSKRRNSGEGWMRWRGGRLDSRDRDVP